MGAYEITTGAVALKYNFGLDLRVSSVGSHFYGMVCAVMGWAFRRRPLLRVFFVPVKMSINTKFEEELKRWVRVTTSLCSTIQMH
jgi:hypothetical protein